MRPHHASTYLQGAFYGAATVIIWAGSIVVARFGLNSGLTPWDIVALRLATAGCLLAPYLMRAGVAFGRLRLTGLAAIVLGGGAPVLMANAGLLFAPAAHAGALFSGVMPLMVALLAAVMLDEEISPQKSVGLALIVVGAMGIVWSKGAIIGNALFLCSGFASAWYTIALRRARLNGLHAAAISAVGSMVLYLPIYTALAGESVLTASVMAVTLQAIVQGVLTAIASLVFYGRAVSILGASNGAAFAALSPVLTALIGIPVLGEWPSGIEWLEIGMISAGVYAASDGPLPGWKCS